MARITCGAPSTWILQVDPMVKPEWFSSAQMQALNPALVMILIPFALGALTDNRGLR